MSTESKVKYLDQNKVTRNSYREADLPVSKSWWAGILFSSLVALIVFGIFTILVLDLKCSKELRSSTTEFLKTIS